MQSDKSNSDLLMKRILDFFKENNLKFIDISAIFVNQGPGNFSGLRGSLAIVKGVSLAKNLKLFGYNTFLWSCVNFFNKEDTIIFGRESEGVPKKVHDDSYERLKIPLKNNQRSLNVSIAVAITLAEAIKQNNF